MKEPLEWKDGQLVKAAILSEHGGKLLVRVGGRPRNFTTKPGQVVELRP